MEIYYNVVRDAEGLKAAIDELKGHKSLGFDTETTELDPYKGDLRLLQISTGDKTQVVDLKPFRSRGDVRTMPELQPLRDLLANETVEKVAHNAKFDAKWVRHHLGCELGGIYDTYLASILISAGEGERRHGLADVVQFFLGRTLDKEQQVSNWAADELSSACRSPEVSALIAAWICASTSPRWARRCAPTRRTSARSGAARPRPSDASGGAAASARR